MARNSEKAHSMLFRFRAAEAASMGILDAGRTRRPKNITSMTSIPVCEKWRGQVLKEVSRKITKIQDLGLSDFQIRDINDEINRLMREKHMWEVQIRSLGGPNYMRGGRVLDADGREVPGGGKGYRYFGRAKELPGVKEMFEAARPKREEGGKGESRAELRRAVDAGYYGYNLDEEDGGLLTYEARVEKENFERLGEEGDGEGKGRKERWEELPGDAGDGVGWRMPTIEDVQEELLDRKRRKLLDRLG
ncbi:MAG: NineTeen Complex (NTC) component [Bogoriella megaspora]|nr:MAG: NineTeen Complex (NTC) component [Bogoriella megaspora]